MISATNTPLLLLFLVLTLGVVSVIVTSVILVNRTKKIQDLIKVAWAVLDNPFSCKTDELNCPLGVDNVLKVYTMTLNAKTFEVIDSPKVVRTLRSSDFGLFRCGLGVENATCGAEIVSTDVDPKNNKIFVLIRKLNIVKEPTHFIFGFDLSCETGGVDFSVSFFARGLNIAAAPATKNVLIIGGSPGQGDTGGGDDFVGEAPALYTLPYAGEPLALLRPHVEFSASVTSTPFSLDLDAPSKMVAAPDSQDIIVRTNTNWFSEGEKKKLIQLLRTQLRRTSPAQELFSMKNILDFDLWAYRFKTDELVFEKSNNEPLQRIFAGQSNDKSQSIAKWSKDFKLLSVDENSGVIVAIRNMMDTQTASIEVLGQSNTAHESASDLPSFTSIGTFGLKTSERLLVLRTASLTSLPPPVISCGTISTLPPL